MIDLDDQSINDFAKYYNSTVITKQAILPSDWYESKKILMPGTAAIPGYVSFYNSPYWKEPLNCISPDHPAIDITIVGPAQDGKTFMVLEPMIGYTIELNPCNILHLTGNSDLSPDAALRVETMIHNCKLGHLIKPQYTKVRNNRTGDTTLRKDFINGIYKNNSITKKNALRFYDVAILILDDADAAKMVDQKVGNIWDVAKGRTKAFESKAKRVCTSSPETKGLSLVWEVFERSDQRHYFVPCPCCHEFIELLPEFIIDESEKAGLTWKVDGLGRVDPKSVGYICQKCAGYFTEQNKLRWLNDGKWIPQCEPVELYHYGYKKSGLYSSPGMTSWGTLIAENLKCNPIGLPRNEPKYRTFRNIMLGELYEPPTDALKATDLMKRCRDYPIGIIPEAVSEADGNGEILLLTLAADCNGTLNDARIDYEVKAWSRNGATYSVKWDSLGTFIPRQSAAQKAKDNREKWTYEMHRPNSVWKLMDEVLGTIWKTDTGRQMKIFISAIDAGYLDAHVFNYIDRSQFGIIGVMGDKENAMVRVQENIPVFKQATSRHNLFMLNVNMLKDDMANRMRLPWDRKNDQSQPHEFMNFPQYTYEGFFAHYESETRRENDKGYFGWQKKSPVHDNHAFDVGIYNYAVVQVFLWRLFRKGNKEEVFTWEHYASQCPVRGK